MARMPGRALPAIMVARPCDLPPAARLPRPLLSASPCQALVLVFGRLWFGLRPSEANFH